MPTRAEIADAIRTRNPKFKDLSDIEIEAIVGGQDPRYRDLFNRASGVDPGLGPEKPPDPTQYQESSPRSARLEALQRESLANQVPLTVDTAVNAIPTAAGMAGGAGGFALGGPVGAIAGATGAGSAGETLRQFIQRARGKEGPREWSDRASDVVKEGVIQGGQEVFGQGTAAAQRAVAPHLYKYAMSPGARLGREFPTMAEDALAARLPIEKLGEARAGELATSRSAEADAMIAAAKQGGAPSLDMITDVLHPTLDAVEPMAQEQAVLGKPGGLDTIQERSDRIRTQGAGTFNAVDLEDAQRYKRRAQKDANAAFRAQDRGTLINDVDTAFDKSIAGSYQAGLENRVPGLDEKNAEAQRAIGMEQGIAAAREKSGLASNIVSGVVGGGAIPALLAGHPWMAAALAGAGGATKAATSPYALSHAAINLDRLGSHPVAQTNAYRAMVEALRQLMATDESSNSGQ